MNGFLLIDKPSGISSAECVYSIRKDLNEKKVGHCGTLDPLATGILPICIGEATKFSNYVSDQSKRYEVKILFGLETDTGDITGKEVSLGDVNFSLNQLKKVLSHFVGEQEQIPPMFSALKKNGKPLYYWARRGVFLKRKPRLIYVDQIELKTFKSYKEVTVEVSCSKGTYIRTLVESIGRQLETYATVLELRRTRIGFLKEEDLTPLNSKGKNSYVDDIVECDQVLKNYPKLVLNKTETKKIRNGQQVDYNARQEKEGIVRLYEEEGSFIGIGNIDLSMKVSPRRLLATKKYSASPSRYKG